MSDTVLTSTANARVRWVKSLHQGKHRRAEGVLLAEGIKAVAELAARPDCLKQVFWAESCTRRPEGAALIEALSGGDVPLQPVADHVLTAMADTRTPQGVVAVAACAPAPLERVLSRTVDVLVLDGLQDPGNVGTLIRTAAAAGAAGVVLVGGCADPTGPKAVRSAAGCLFSLPFTLWREPIEPLAAALKRADCRIAVYRASGGTRPDRLGAGRIAWIVGAEGAGVSDLWDDRADLSVAIPMAGGVESLNVAVAGGLLLFSRLLAP